MSTRAWREAGGVAGGGGGGAGTCTAPGASSAGAPASSKLSSTLSASSSVSWSASPSSWLCCCGGSKSSCVSAVSSSQASSSAAEAASRWSLCFVSQASKASFTVPLRGPRRRGAVPSVQAHLPTPAAAEQRLASVPSALRTRSRQPTFRKPGPGCWASPTRTPRQPYRAQVRRSRRQRPSLELRCPSKALVALVRRLRVTPPRGPEASRVEQLRPSCTRPLPLRTPLLRCPSAV